MLLTLGMFSVAIFLAVVAKAVFYLPSKLRPKQENSEEGFFNRASGRSAGGGCGGGAPDAEEPPIVIPTDPVQALQRILAENENDLYRTLGASRTATPEELKKLFRRQSLMVHPDKNKHKVRGEEK